MAPRERRPRSVYATGGEPDPRFSLANERTFLAWVRTGLALLAAGVALEALGGTAVQPGLRQATALLLVVLGTLTPVHAFLGWARAERAMRQGRPLPAPRLALPIALGCAVAGALVLVGVLTA